MAVALLGELMRARRLELRLEQAELAELVGVSQQTISRWERGEALPRRARVQALAAALGTEPETITRYAGIAPSGDGDVTEVEFHRLYERIECLTDTELALLVERAWTMLRSRIGLGLSRACP